MTKPEKVFKTRKPSGDSGNEVVLGVDMRTSIVSVFVKNSLDTERQDNLIYFAFKESF